MDKLNAICVQRIVCFLNEHEFISLLKVSKRLKKILLSTHSLSFIPNIILRSQIKVEVLSGPAVQLADFFPNESVSLSVSIQQKGDIEVLRMTRSLDSVTELKIAIPSDVRKVVYRMHNVQTIRQVAGAHIVPVGTIPSLRRWVITDFDTCNACHKEILKEELGEEKECRQLLSKCIYMRRFLIQDTSLCNLLRGFVVINDTDSVLSRFLMKVIAEKRMLISQNVSRRLKIGTEDLQETYLGVINKLYLPTFQIQNTEKGTIFPTYISFLINDSVNVGNCMSLKELLSVSVILNGVTVPIVDFRDCVQLYSFKASEKTPVKSIFLPSSIKIITLTKVNTPITVSPASKILELTCTGGNRQEDIHRYCLRVVIKK